MMSRAEAGTSIHAGFVAGNWLLTFSARQQVGRGFMRRLELIVQLEEAQRNATAGAHGCTIGLFRAARRKYR
jgi:hypothetical protein